MDLKPQHPQHPQEPPKTPKAKALPPREAPPPQRDPRRPKAQAQARRSLAELALGFRDSGHGGGEFRVRGFGIQCLELELRSEGFGCKMVSDSSFLASVDCRRFRPVALQPQPRA